MPAMPRKKKNGEAPARHVNRKEVTKMLRSPLAAGAKDEALVDLLRSLKDHEELETEKKEVSSGYSDRLKALAEQAKELRLRIEEGVEEAVECEEVRDFDAGTWTLKRLDTGEEVERRDLTEDERQPDLLEGENNEAAQEAP